VPVSEARLRELVYSAISRSPSGLVTVDELYEFVAQHVTFDAKDLEPPTLHNQPVSEPAWKRNVRNALQSEKLALRLVNVGPALWRKATPLPAERALDSSSLEAIFSNAREALDGGLVLRDPVTGTNYLLAEVRDDSLTLRRLRGGGETLVTRGHLEIALDRLNAAGGESGRGTLQKTIAREIALVELHPRLAWTNGGRGIGIRRAETQPAGVAVAVSATRAAEAGEFALRPGEDERTWVLRRVAERQGQPAFRAALLEAYQAACAVTRTDVPAVLEAAHIHPRRGEAWDRVQNGLLLRCDVHTLFDLGLIGVDGNVVKASDELSGTEYAILQGRLLALPQPETLRPSSAALAWHLANVFQGSML
jgi:hypothetical protein